MALCLLSVLLYAACGSRLPEDVLESLDARNTGTGPTVAAGSGSVNGGGTEGGTVSGAGGAVASGQAVGASTGGGTSVAGTGLVQPGSKCAEARSAAPGVSDKEIKVASIVTDSGPLPGATEGSYRGAASYLAMVNALGGVCGRKITLLKGDDGLDGAKARSEFLRLEPNVLGFVGSFAVADAAYIDLIKSTAVPYVSLVIEPAGRGFRNVFPQSNDDYVSTGPFVWWKQQHPNVKRAAILFADVGGVAANIGGVEAAIEQAGFDRRYTGASEVASPDYTPEVQQAQDEEIEFLYLFAFEVNMHVRFVRNMRQQNYDPPIKGAVIAFNTRFSQLLGSDGDGWENNTTYLLFLDPKERTRSKPLAQFLDWNNRVFPGAQLDLFPVSGWGRAAVFVEALQKIEGAITREALIDALYTVRKFDGGGIEVPIDPTTGVGEGCWAMAVHKGGQWQRAHPTSELFECGLGQLYKYR